jgi:hypothetical protein
MSLAVTRGAFAHLFNRALVFMETNADDLGQTSRRSHLRAPAMRQAGRDALALVAIAAAIFFYRLQVDPAVGTAMDAIDWRFHFVWMHPLIVVALAPLLFHPYIMGGRDLRPRRPRAPRAVPAATDSGRESPEWAATRRQGAA